MSKVIIQLKQLNMMNRQKRIEDFGVRFLRFDDLDVKKKMSWVLEEIELWVIDHKDELVGRFENREITNLTNLPTMRRSEQSKEGNL